MSNRPSPPRCYVISHERSGTHFTLDSISRNFPAYQEFHNIGEWFGPYDRPEQRFAALDRAAAQLPGWRGLIKSHCDRPLYTARYAAAPVIYVVRDPRDVLVSWWHYLNEDAFYLNNPLVASQRAATLGEFLRRPASAFLRLSYSLHGDFGDVVGRWCAHVGGWTRPDPAVHVLRYEELHQRFEATMDQLADVLGCPRRPTYQRPTLEDGSGHLTRQGRIGGWRAYLTPADEAHVRENVTRHGLERFLVDPSGSPT